MHGQGCVEFGPGGKELWRGRGRGSDGPFRCGRPFRERGSDGPFRCGRPLPCRVREVILCGVLIRFRV